MSSSYGMRARFAVGQVDGGWLHLAIGKVPSGLRPVDAGTALYRDLYWRLYVRNQPAWVGGGGYKLTRAISLATPGWAEAMTAQVWGDPPATGYLYLDPASGTDLAGNLVTTRYNDFPNLRWLGAKAGVTSLFDASHVGRWYCVEIHALLNDAGQANGVFEYWINGALVELAVVIVIIGVLAAFGVPKFLASVEKSKATEAFNFWASVQSAQERYLDNIVVSTRRIGCLTL